MTLTKDSWNSLTEKAQWDIKTALRGPDCFNSEYLKFWTTSVIRYTCREAFRVGGSLNQQISFVIVPSGKYTSPIKPEHFAFGFNWGHFAEHVRDAAEYLGLPTVQIKPELYLMTLTTPPKLFAGMLSGTKKLNGIASETFEAELAAVQSYGKGW
jgi:hypothetical protein